MKIGEKLFFLMLILFQTFYSWSQGIQCNIEFNPDFKPIDRVPSNVKKVKDQKKFNEASDWNIPACYSDANNELRFNWLAYKFGDFKSVVQEGYKIVDDKNPKGREQNKAYLPHYWISRDLIDGKSLVWRTQNREEEKIPISKEAYIFQIQTEEGFYNSFKETNYESIVKEFSDGSNRDKANLLNRKLDQFVGVRSVLDTLFQLPSFHYVYQTKISFNNKEYDLPGNLSSTRDIRNYSLNGKIDDLINKWAQSNYLRKDGYKISTYKEISLTINHFRGDTILINQDTIYNRLKQEFGDGNLILPKNMSHIKVDKSELNWEVSGLKGHYESFNKVIHVELPEFYSAYWAGCVFGSGYKMLTSNAITNSVIKKRAANLQKGTLTTIGVTIVSAITKSIFYDRYLKSPNVRTLSYNIANTSHKVFMGGVTIYATLFTIDLLKSIQTVNNTKYRISQFNNIQSR